MVTPDDPFDEVAAAEAALQLAQARSDQARAALAEASRTRDALTYFQQQVNDNRAMARALNVLIALATADDRIRVGVEHMARHLAPTASPDDELARMLGSDPQ